MRVFLTVIILLFLGNSSFAEKSGADTHIFTTQLQVKTKSNLKFSRKVWPGSEDQQHFQLNNTENRNLHRIQLSEFSPASIRITDMVSNRYYLYPEPLLCLADPAVIYQFIFHLLYPKHVFW